MYTFITMTESDKLKPYTTLKRRTLFRPRGGGGRGCWLNMIMSVVPLVLSFTFFMIIFVLSVIFSDLRLPQPQTVERANFTVKLFVCFITFNVIMGYTCPVDDEM